MTEKREPSLIVRDDDDQSHGSMDSVKVICRVRPFARREVDIHLETHSMDEPIRPVIMMEGNYTIFLDPETFQERERFAFDHSLWSLSAETSPCEQPFATQAVVMDTVGLPAISHVWSGFNVSLFAYGQTGSGKTYTMMGGEEEPGLIPRMCQELFRSLEVRRAEESARPSDGTVKEFRLEARFLEIYNDKVKDLLWELRNASEPHDGIDHENLKVRHIPNLGPIIVGLTAVSVDKWEDCLRLIEEGTRHRSVAATKMNATSSRSHSIFRLNFVQTTRVLATRPYEKPKSFDKVSNVSLVDLAGSERNKKTGAQGDRLKEAVAINKSLTALKNVIDALVEGRPVIPFRDSQLTFLLSESLGGNSKTFMIACVSPHSDNADETLNTLRYALRAQGIVCHAVANESEELRKMNQMRQELEQLRLLKEEPQDLTHELRRAHEGKREQLASMQSVSAKQQERQMELQRHVDLSSELRHNSRYQMAFRVTLAKRVQSACEKELQEQERCIDVIRCQIRDAEKLLQGATSRRTASAKSESDAKTLFKAREKELESLRSRCSALEWRKRTLMKQDEESRLAAERKLNMKPSVTLVTRLLKAFHLYRLQNKLQVIMASSDEKVANARAERTKQESLLNAYHAQLVQDVDSEIAALEEELRAAKEAHAANQKQFADRIHQLHAECIFLETELKEATEVHEKAVAAVGKTKAAAFFAAKEEWAAKLQREGFAYQQAHAALASEFEGMMRSIVDREKGHLAKLAHDSAAALQRVVEASVTSADALTARENAMSDKIEALNRESAVFLYSYRHIEQRFAQVARKLLFDKLHSADTLQLQNLLVKPGKPVPAASLLEALSEPSPPKQGLSPHHGTTTSLAPTAARVPERKAVHASLLRPRSTGGPKSLRE